MSSVFTASDNAYIEWRRKLASDQKKWSSQRSQLVLRKWKKKQSDKSLFEKEEKRVASIEERKTELRELQKLKEELLEDTTNIHRREQPLYPSSNHCSVLTERLRAHQRGKDALASLKENKNKNNVVIRVGNESKYQQKINRKLEPRIKNEEQCKWKSRIRTNNWGSGDQPNIDLSQEFNSIDFSKSYFHSGNTTNTTPTLLENFKGHDILSEDDNENEKSYLSLSNKISHDIMNYNVIGKCKIGNYLDVTEIEEEEEEMDERTGDSTDMSECIIPLKEIEEEEEVSYEKPIKSKYDDDIKKEEKEITEKKKPRLNLFETEGVMDTELTDTNLSLKIPGDKWVLTDGLYDFVNENLL